MNSWKNKPQPTQLQNYNFLQKWNQIPDIAYFYKNGIEMVTRLIPPEAKFAKADTLLIKIKKEYNLENE